MGLTTQEYQKNLTGWDNSVAGKTFIVLLFAYYYGFYYTAFVARALGDTTYKAYGPTPWESLTYQMCTTFVLYLAFTAYDLASPMLSLYKQKKEEMKKLGLKTMEEYDKKISYLELQSKMTAYDGDLLNADYTDIVLLLGYILNFGITMPITVAVGFIYVSLQLRVDLWKLCH